jgi:DNA adenine methylase
MGNTESKKYKSIPSLIKWTGSKRGLSSKIQPYIPNYNRYIEPFLGGGAMLYLNAHPGAIAADIYEPLIDLWKLIQNRVDAVLAHYAKNWEMLQNDLPGHFYKVRDRFNKSHDPLDLLFLTRTCVNGIIRFNKDGDFNNSFHLSRKGMTPSGFSSIAKKWSAKIQGVQFICSDYTKIAQEARDGDFLYLDPPYAQNKNRYIMNLDLAKFFNTLQELTKRKIKFALSFDGMRDNNDLGCDIPEDIFRKKILLNNGHSAVNKVLSNTMVSVGESLYLNY